MTVTPPLVHICQRNALVFLYRIQEKTKEWSDLRKKQMERFGSVWQPQKRLTRYQMDYLRTLKQEQPEEWTISKLSTRFGISTSAVLRILKSKWDPPPSVKDRQDKRAIDNREERRRKARERISMDDGGGKSHGHTSYRKPNNKDLIIDFDT